jgi:hypothetical protein
MFRVVKFASITPFVPTPEALPTLSLRDTGAVMVTIMKTLFNYRAGMARIIALMGLWRVS